jgi:hypothetical protein
MNDVSFEIGMCYIPIVGAPGATDAEQQVYAALFAHRTQITAAAAKFDVSRVAIAGAIAWEMLENVRPSGWRSVGWGKVHTFNFPAFWDDPIAKEVEDRGYLPKRTSAEREALLARPESAIVYIAAIMAAIADAAEARHGASIRMNPEVLTNVYQSKDLDDWERHLDRKAPGSGFSGGNPMDKWVIANRSFLEAAVGKDE